MRCYILKGTILFLKMREIREDFRTSLRIHFPSSFFLFGIPTLMLIMKIARDAYTLLNLANIVALIVD